MKEISENEKVAEINFWIDFATKTIEKRKTMIKNGKSNQTFFTTMAGSYLDRGRAKFLRGDPIDNIRKDFRKSAECIEMSFIMAYDDRSPHYLGDKADLAEVSMTYAIDGFNACMMAGDFLLGRHLARLAKVPPHRVEEFTNPKKQEILVTNYMYALRHILLGEDDKSLEYARATEKWFSSRGIPQKNAYHKNFFHRARMVRAILENNPALFDESMTSQLKTHAHNARFGDIADTDEAYVYDDGVALCNLAIHKGLNFSVEADTIPKGLLIARKT